MKYKLDIKSCELLRYVVLTMVFIPLAVFSQDYVSQVWSPDLGNGT